MENTRGTLRRSKWLSTATQNIRFEPDRVAVERELRAHIEDKTADFQRIFPDMTPEEAEDRAISEMGDPAELGRELARIHKPWLGYLWRASQVLGGLLIAAYLVLSLEARNDYRHPLWGICRKLFKVRNFEPMEGWWVMAKKQRKYMVYSERVRLEEKLRHKVPVAEIARELGFSRQTIYNEIRRGTYIHTCEWWDEERYSADKGQAIHDQAQLRKTGRPLKIGHDLALANFLESRMLGVQDNGSIDRRRRQSPSVALAEARAAGFQLRLSVGTIYNYITQGVFYSLTNNDLWVKPTLKPKAESKVRVAHPQLPSIEQRPDWIRLRLEYGHWEMDLVVGPQGSRAALLTLTERRSREELIFRLPNKKAVSVRKVFNKLEREMGRKRFREKFKTITTDNGSEFMEHDRLVRSVYGGTRFQVWYCHSYAAWEKGSNENHNRMIRRWFPKGTDFAKVSKKEVAELQDWMNGYPRKILGWRTPKDVAA